MKKGILALVLLASFSMSAQEGVTAGNEEMIEKNNQHFLGLHAGMSTGIGFSYKYVHNNNFGLQVTGIPVASRDDTYTNFWSSAGLALTYRFGESSFNHDPIRFLVYAGANHLFSYDSYESSYTNGNPYNNISIDHRVNTAAGFGLEYTTMERLNLNVMAGYGLFLDGGARTTLSLEAGLHYRLGK